MCTAIRDENILGRTLDVNGTLGENAVAVPRNYRFDFINEGAYSSDYAIVGIAHMSNGIPLFYDAMNENGLAAAGLSFPKYTVYNKAKSDAVNVASFEFIPYILSRCRELDDAAELCRSINITDDCFSSEIDTTPLHFIISDKKRSLVIEPTALGTAVYEDAFNVLTNSPDFLYHVGNVNNYIALDSHTPKNTLCPDIDAEPNSNGIGALGMPGDYSSASRFIRAVFMKNHTATDSDRGDRISRFFHMADSVSVPLGCVKNSHGENIYTRYISCYDLENKGCYFNTYNCRRIRRVMMNESLCNTDSLTLFSMDSAEDIADAPKI